MKAIKKHWPQPIEIDERWIPFLVEDIAAVNLESWMDKLKTKEQDDDSKSTVSTTK